VKDFKIYIIIASVLLALYVLVEYNQPKPVIWTPTYARDDKIPFGTYVLYHQINDIFPGSEIRNFREPAYNVINDHDINYATYIIICEDINLNEYDIKKLMEFIKKGNDVLISANSFSALFSKKFHIETDADYQSGSKPDSIHFVNQYLNKNKRYALRKKSYSVYFSEIDTARAVSLAQNQSGQSTLVRYKTGKGALYLNTNSEQFTNYSLLKPDGADYASKVLSHLKNSKTILWDEYYTKGREGEESMMRVFLRNASLSAAYYITLVSLIIFVFYQMKRRQRIIPVIEPLQNSTLDFVNVVGQVYYEQRNNQNIAEKKILFFLEHLRTLYFVRTNPLNEEFIQQLSQKTGINYPFVQEVVEQINYISAQKHVNDQELIKLNHLIEQFYIKAR